MYFPKNHYGYQSNINQLAEPEFGRTKKIHVWEYGDSYNKDYEIFINPNNLRTWNSILKYLTDVINPTFGAVRKLVSLTSKRAMGCFAELKHNEKYVAIGAITRIKVHQPDSYKTVSELDIIAKSKKVKKLYSGEIGPPEFKHLLKATERRLIITFILVNGRPCQTPTKLVLTKNDLRSWDVILEYLSKVMDVPDGLQYICTVFGEILFSPDQLQHGYIYVAVPFNEKFVKMDYVNMFSKKKGYTLKIRPATKDGKIINYDYVDGNSPHDAEDAEDAEDGEDAELEAVAVLLSHGLDSKDVKDKIARSNSYRNAGKDIRVDNIVPQQPLQNEEKSKKSIPDRRSSLDVDSGKISRKSKTSSDKTLKSNTGSEQAGKDRYFKKLKEDFLESFDNIISANSRKRRSETKSGSGRLSLEKKTAENIDGAGSFDLIKEESIQSLDKSVSTNNDFAKSEVKIQTSNDDIRSNGSSRLSIEKKYADIVDSSGFFDVIKQQLTKSLETAISLEEFVKRRGEIRASLEDIESNGSDRLSFEEKSIDQDVADGAAKKVQEAKRTSARGSKNSSQKVPLDEDESAAVPYVESDALLPTEELDEGLIDLELEESYEAVNTILHDIYEKAIQTDDFIPIVTNLKDLVNEIKDTVNANETRKNSGNTANKASKRKTSEIDTENVKGNGKKPFPGLNGIKKDGGITAALSENNLCSKNKHVPSIHIRNRTDINFCGFSSKSKKSIICQDNKTNTYRKLYLNKSFSSPDRTSSSSESEVIRVDKGNKCCFCIHRNKSNKMNKIWEDDEKISKGTKTDCMDTEIIVGFMGSETGEATEDALKETDVSGHDSDISIDSIEAEGSKNIGFTENQVYEARENPDAVEGISGPRSCLSLDSIDGKTPE